MLDIAEVARRSGLPASALRYYETRGLIQSLGRKGLRRTFEAGVLRRLAFISLGRSVGFSLEEVAKLIGDGPAVSLDRSMLSSKADELDATIFRLSAVRDELRRAADCPQSQHADCPTFQRQLEASAAANRGRRGSSAGGAPEV